MVVFIFQLNYAVITFTCENNEEYISAAPKNWIDDDEKSCKWPKSKTIEKKAINLQMKPENDWKQYTIVKVFGYYGKIFIVRLLLTRMA